VNAATRLNFKGIETTIFLLFYGGLIHSADVLRDLGYVSSDYLHQISPSLSNHTDTIAKLIAKDILVH
jgi:hypothetical protein